MTDRDAVYLLIGLLQVVLAFFAGRDLRDRNVRPLVGAAVAFLVLVAPLIGLVFWALARRREE